MHVLGNLLSGYILQVVSEQRRWIDDLKIKVMALFIYDLLQVVVYDLYCNTEAIVHRSFLGNINGTGGGVLSPKYNILIKNLVVILAYQ